MNPVPSTRLQSIGGYAFAEVDREVERLRASGIEPTDFGVGDPSSPTPPRIRTACALGIERHAATGYPPYPGNLAFRRAVADWVQRRHGVGLDPETEVTSSIGSKEAIFHFAECFVNPGDVVIAPSPGYPPYKRGTLFAEGTTFYYPLTRENGFLPDLDGIPDAIADRARILWVNYPNSPSGRVIDRDAMARIVRWAAEREIILASDEAYSEIWFTEEPPPSALEFGRDGVVVFQSLSKRSAMTGYRVGWVAGDERIVAAFRKLKTNLDSGTPSFVQEAAIEALADETHVEAFRREYREKRDLLCEALVATGLPDCTPEGTIYVWQRAPEGVSGVDLARALLAADIACVVTPGEWISDPLPDGRGGTSNPGAGHVRFALVPELASVRSAAERIRRGRIPCLT